MSQPQGRTPQAYDGGTPTVIAGIESVLAPFDLTALAGRSIEALRTLRHQLDEVEAGLSYGRRMAQGRIDILLCELDRRSGDETAGDLINLLPDALSGHLRGGGSPRPLVDVELPSFADRIVSELDTVLTPSALGAIDDLSVEQLETAVDQFRSAEREIGQQRREVHRVIDEIQEEIIGRYRSGAAKVEDLLT